MTAIWEEKLDGLDASEVHWSTGTILTIFFAASLITAVFFGLGYTFGRGGISMATTGTALSAMPAPPQTNGETPIAGIFQQSGQADVEQSIVGTPNVSDGS